MGCCLATHLLASANCVPQAQCCKCFILIRRNEIHSCLNGCLPAQAHLFERPEIVTRSPTKRVGFRMSIESIEPNPKASCVGGSNHRPKAFLVYWTPITCLSLPALLYGRPGIVPPTSIVRRSVNSFESGRWVIRNPDCTKQPQSTAHRDRIMKCGLLRIRATRQNQYGPHLYWGRRFRTGCARGSAEPIFVFSQQFPD